MSFIAQISPFVHLFTIKIVFHMGGFTPLNSPPGQRALDLLGALSGPQTARRKLCLHFILYLATPLIKNCWVRLLSNYNIKSICTIYTRLHTCLMSISRFSLRDKVTLRLLKLYLIADVVEWYRVLDISLSDWCCSVSTQRSIYNTVWLNFFRRI
jgi:hypothetical protein